MNAMNKAFVKETDEADDEAEYALPAIPAGAKNYITPAGYQRIKDELLQLIDIEAKLLGNRRQDGSDGGGVGLDFGKPSRVDLRFRARQGRMKRWLLNLNCHGRSIARRKKSSV